MYDCPPLRDVLTMLELLEDIGCRCSFEQGTVHIDPSGINNCKMNDRLMHLLRSSIFILGPLVARMGRAELGYPGGCDIGIRPIDLHLKGLRDLGVEVQEENGHIICTCSKLKGGEVYLDYPSVGATENIMMAATLAEGATVITNAAKEPEIVDLQNLLILWAAASAVPAQEGSLFTVRLCLTDVNIQLCRIELSPARI